MIGGGGVMMITKDDGRRVVLCHLAKTFQLPSFTLLQVWNNILGNNKAFNTKSKVNFDFHNFTPQLLRGCSYKFLGLIANVK